MTKYNSYKEILDLCNAGHITKIYKVGKLSTNLIIHQKIRILMQKYINKETESL